MTDIWTIPLDGVNYICWGKNGEHVPLTDIQSDKYFRSENKEACLKEILFNEILSS